MNVLPLRIFLEQPVLVTRSGGDPNSVVSLDYLPGSLLRGVLIERYLKLKSNAPRSYDLPGDATARRLFFDGEVRLLNAYLLNKGEQRTLPSPLALLQYKSANTQKAYEVFNAAHEDWNEKERRELEREREDQLKSFGASYCSLSGNEVLGYAPDVSRIAVHVQRDRQLGRSTKDSGAVFQYEALAAGQWFAGAILIERQDDLELIQELLQAEQAWLGRSRSANYGQVRIECRKPITKGWRELETDQLEAVAAGQPLTITLLSDLLLRDSEGTPVASLAYQPSLDQRIADRILSAYLGFEVNIDPVRSFSVTTLASGFNQTWRLPLLQQPALAAGSVFTLHPCADVAQETLQQLEDRGIGERRSEGFGRIAFQWFDDLQYRAIQGELFRESQALPPLSSTGRAAAQRMARHMLEEVIERELQRYVRDRVINAQPQPSNLPRNSQLGRLRALLRQARKYGELTLIAEEMAQFKTVAQEQLANARMGSISLRTWLDEVLQPDGVWQILDLRPANWPKVAEVAPEPDATLTTMTTLRLIDAVLTALHRKNKREQA